MAFHYSSSNDFNRHMDSLSCHLLLYFSCASSAEAFHHLQKAPIESYQCHPKTLQAWLIASIFSKPAEG